MVNGVEMDFLQEVREARKEDCMAIIKALQTIEGIEDEDGELTPLGMLAEAIADELFVNGVMKHEAKD